MTGMGARKDEAHTLCTYRVLQEKVKRFRNHIGEYKKRIISMSQTYHLYEPDVPFPGAQMLAEAHTLAARTRSDGRADSVGRGLGPMIHDNPVSVVNLYFDNNFC